MTEWIGLEPDYLKYMGFVYKIVNTINGKYYIGLKLFHHKTTKYLVRKPTKVEASRLGKYKVKNKVKYADYKLVLKKKYKGLKKVIRGTKESDWRTYWGSSKELLSDIEKYGEENFSRIIIRHCETKFDCAYHELLQQLENNVLFDEKSYNGIINVRLSRRK